MNLFTSIVRCICIIAVGYDGYNGFNAMVTSRLTLMTDREIGRAARCKKRRCIFCVLWSVCDRGWSGDDS
jgi:hypothetical protein